MGLVVYNDNFEVCKYKFSHCRFKLDDCRYRFKVMKNGLAVCKHKLESLDGEAIHDFAEKLSVLTEQLADELYNIDEFQNSTNVKLREWCKAAYKYQSGAIGYNLLYPKYGYAVEEYVNLSLTSKRVSPPRGYIVRLQVTHGKTRPDIVVLNSYYEEIAWLDITSQRNEGHILNKSGNWAGARNYVAELLYNDLDPAQITTGNSIASHAASRVNRAAKQMNSKLMRHMADHLNDVLENLKHYYNPIDNTPKTPGEKDLPLLAQVIEKKFGIEFSSNYKHAIIYSMLEMYVEIPEIKIDYLNAANVWLNIYRQKNKNTNESKYTRNKPKAMSYITDSYNLTERWADISDDEDTDKSGDYVPNGSDDDYTYELDFEEYCNQLAAIDHEVIDQPAAGVFDPEAFFG